MISNPIIQESFPRFSKARKSFSDFWNFKSFVLQQKSLIIKGMILFRFLELQHPLFFNEKVFKKSGKTLFRVLELQHPLFFNEKVFKKS